NKLFYFFSYEGLRNNSTDFTNAFIETPQYRQLIISRRPNGLLAKVFQTPGMEPRIVTVIPRDCSAIPGFPCQVVPGGLVIGSPTGRVGQSVPMNQRAGGGLDGIPDIEFAQLALPSHVHGNQYNFRFDFSPDTTNQFAFSTYITQFSGLTSDAAGKSRP